VSALTTVVSTRAARFRVSTEDSAYLPRTRTAVAVQSASTASTVKSVSTTTIIDTACSRPITLPRINNYNSNTRHNKNNSIKNSDEHFKVLLNLPYFNRIRAVVPKNRNDVVNRSIPGEVSTVASIPNEFRTSSFQIYDELIVDYKTDDSSIVRKFQDQTAL